MPFRTTAITGGFLLGCRYIKAHIRRLDILGFNGYPPVNI